MWGLLVGNGAPGRWGRPGATRGRSFAAGDAECEGRDSNPYPFRDQDLNLARLPIPPPSRELRPFAVRLI